MVEDKVKDAIGRIFSGIRDALGSEATLPDYMTYRDGLNVQEQEYFDRLTKLAQTVQEAYGDGEPQEVLYRNYVAADEWHNPIVLNAIGLGKLRHKTRELN